MIIEDDPYEDESFPSISHDNPFDDMSDDYENPFDDMSDDNTCMDIDESHNGRKNKLSGVDPIQQDSSRVDLLRTQMNERVSNCINGNSTEHLDRPHRVLMFQQTHRNVNSIEKGRYNAPTAGNFL